MSLFLGGSCKMEDLAPCTFYEEEDNIEQIHVLCVQYAGTSLSSEKCLPGYGRGECIPDLQPYKHLCTLKWREVLSDTLPVKISGSQLPYALQDSTVFTFDTIANYLNYMITKCQAAEHFVNYYMIVQWYEHALVTKGAQYPAFFEALKATGSARLLFESETNEWWEAKELMRLRETLCFQKKVTNALVSKPMPSPLFATFQKKDGSYVNLARHKKRKWKKNQEAEDIIFTCHSFAVELELHELEVNVTNLKLLGFGNYTIQVYRTARCVFLKRGLAYTQENIAKFVQEHKQILNKWSVSPMLLSTSFPYVPWSPLPSLSSSSNLVTTQEKTNDDELEEMDFQCCTTSDSD